MTFDVLTNWDRNDQRPIHGGHINSHKFSDNLLFCWIVDTRYVYSSIQFEIYLHDFI